MKENWKIVQLTFNGQSKRKQHMSPSVARDAIKFSIHEFKQI